jgi:hypothetical protein
MQNITQETLKKQKGTFSKEEDDLIISFVDKNGLNSFQKITSVLPTRTVRQNRERYRLYLDPTVNRNPFTSEENDLLLKLVIQYQQKWFQIAKQFNRRTDVALKYRYNKLSRRLGFQQIKAASNEITNSLISKYV